DEMLLLGARDFAQLDHEESEVRFVRPLPQQGAERRVAVELRKAAPHHLAQRTHQGADGPVPDQGEIERAHRAGSAAPCSSQARTARTSRSRRRAVVRPGPTFTEWPCRRLTVTKACSSVESSPTNTGVRPRNGSSCMNSSTATPLSLPAGLISTTRFPAWTLYAPPDPATSERTRRWAYPARRGARRECSA